MLVLSRKVGEQIVIGEGVVVTVLSIRNSQVRIGIQAPNNVPIWRGELSFFGSKDEVTETKECHAPLAELVH